MDGEYFGVNGDDFSMNRFTYGDGVTVHSVDVLLFFKCSSWSKWSNSLRSFLFRHLDISLMTLGVLSASTLGDNSPSKNSRQCFRLSPIVMLSLFDSIVLPVTSLLLTNIGHFVWSVNTFNTGKCCLDVFVRHRFIIK